MRDGAEYFTEPASSAQRRYEALRAYFLHEMSAAEVADRFGYSTASIHQMASLLRQGRLTLFAGTRPGPKGPRKATGRLRQRVLELRAAGHSVTEIAAALAARNSSARERSVPVALRGPLGPGLVSANRVSRPLRSKVAIWWMLAVEYPNRSATSAAGISSVK